ncbi:Signal transduction histidine kinase [Microbispora rosea]|uniref:histidine kinase n=2 Tax=Microbispora rosea TaxID=58117 RepID=A0A1N7D3J1_9ACTN|nr:HAMP domain-containing sensor histidine kinase [Microbispora rosea]GIH48891.1 two-component sensor histidine kinase [Microbispora rosea subsp. rosea]SIR70370.1 Signal transduction histidine kinase [Microbispora rosea]
MLLPRRSPSLRARLALLATGTAAILLIPLAIVVHVLVRDMVADRIWDRSLDTATSVAAQIRDGHLPNPIPTAGNDIDLIEVAGPDGRVVAESPAAEGVPRLSPLRPASDREVTQTTACSLSGRDCLYVTVLRVSPGPGSELVYAGRAAPAILDTSVTLPALLLAALLLTALAGWTAYNVTGRALRPVEAIRSELAEITERNPGGRVPEPPGDDEFSRLAQAANDALSRLDTSIQRQRQFAADASHELLTPIAGIRAQLESARLHPEDTCEALCAALRDTERLEAIVADLLLLARIPTAPATAREEVDLSQLVVSEIARRPEQLPTHLHNTPGVTVRGVRRHLARVVTNLLDNAERHALTVVCVRVTRTEDTAVLCVRNDGRPISEADRERIFERFYRTDAARSRDRGGTGLGLAIAREVVEAHGGSIGVEDVTDGEPGVRFVITLPLAPDAADDPAERPADDPAGDPADDRAADDSAAGNAAPCGDTQS